MEAHAFDKNIIYETPPNVWHPPGSFDGLEMWVLDKDILPGAALVMAAYFAGPWTKEETFAPHSHNHDEVLMFFGTDYSKPRELGGEVEFWFNDDQYFLTRACTIFVPKMVQHNPMRPLRVDDPSKPILWVGVTLNSDEENLTWHSKDPKWSEFKQPPEGMGPAVKRT